MVRQRRGLYLLTHCLQKASCTNLPSAGADRDDFVDTRDEPACRWVRLLLVLKGVHTAWNEAVNTAMVHIA